jgi:hypothetical protein
MFTWEEAGLLRQMLLVLKWGAITLVVAVALYLHAPLTSGLLAGWHMVESTFQTLAHHKNPQAAQPDASSREHLVAH